jgi:hypothetical protein
MGEVIDADDEEASGRLDTSDGEDVFIRLLVSKTANRQ